MPIAKIAPFIRGDEMTDLRIIKVENQPQVSYLDAALDLIRDDTVKMVHLDPRHRRELLQYINDLEEENQDLRATIKLEAYQ